MQTVNPSELQLSALCEVANIGAGHAARALSVLTGGDKVGIDVPRAMRVDVEGLAQLLRPDGPAPDAVVCALGVDMVGPLTGKIVIAWPQRDALELARRLLHHEVRALDEPEVRSALEEAANIMASACLNAVGELSHLELLPSVPSLLLGGPEAVAGSLMREEVLRLDKARWVFEAGVFSQSIRGRLLLFPDAESVPRLLAQLKV